MPESPQILGVLFDLDNTLFDRDGAFGRWAAWLIASYATDLSASDQSAMLATILEWDDHGYTPKSHVFEKMRTLHPNFPAINEIMQHFRAEYAKHFGILEETTHTLLAQLKDRGIALGIVSNGALTQWHKIRHLDLEQYTSCIFVSDEFGSKKPYPKIFLAAAEQLGLAPQNILFVGDHIEFDIIGAQRVGMQTAWLPGGRTWPLDLTPITPDFTITSLSELLTIIPLKDI